MTGHVEVLDAVDAPQTIRAAFPDVERFIIEEPTDKPSLAFADALQQLKQIELADGWNFLQQPGVIDGKIIHTGSKVPAIIAEMSLLQP